jgi:hypothetical protein
VRTHQRALGGLPKELTLAQCSDNAQLGGFDPDSFGPPGTIVLLYPYGGYISRYPDGTHAVMVFNEELEGTQEACEAFLVEKFPEACDPENAI